jgi:iron complex outermembrane receptor protein
MHPIMKKILLNSLKHALLILAELLIGHFAFGQNTDYSQIIGKVVNDQQETVAFANILVSQVTDSSLVKLGTTDTNGNFRIAGLEAGRYFLQVSYVGTSDFTSQPFQLRNGQSLRFPTIKMETSAVDLTAVEVKSKRALIEVRPDKTVFNVEGSINATGNTALELLRKSPGVLVDNSDNILLMGKNGVRVYIDGKPSPLGADDLAIMLKSMQSSEIEAIEIITNPSSKFDAEGNAGIINIRLKKDKSLGLNANLNLGYSVGVFSKYNTTATFNNRSKKSNVFGTYSFNDGQDRSWVNLYRTQNNTYFEQESHTIRTGAFHSLRLGTDLFLSEKSTLGILLNGSFNDQNWTNYSFTPIIDLADKTAISALDAYSQNDGVRNNVNANLNYQWKNGEGQQLNIDVDLGVFRNRTDTYQPNFYLTPNRKKVNEERIFTAEAPTDIRIYTAKLDYERPIWGGKLEAGMKFSLVRTDNAYEFFQLVNAFPIRDIDRSNQFGYDENINAAYLSFSKKIKKFNLSFGLRAEQTNSVGSLSSEKATDNSIVKRHYLSLFPSGGVSYQLDRKNQFRFNYSRRIGRPNYQSLNPFEFKMDELSYSRGNPFLRPQYTDNLQLSHTFQYTLTTSLSYSTTNDFFAELSDTTEVSSTFLETVNLGSRKVLSFNVSYPFSLAKWWNTYTNVGVSNTSNDADFGEGRLIDIDQTTFSLYHQSTFILPKGFSLQLSGWYSSPSIWGALYESRSMWSMDAGIQKKLWGGRANIVVSVSDLFYTAFWRADQQFGGLAIQGSGGWESRQFRVNFSYLIGNQQVKAARKRKTGLEDEKSRVD